MGLREIFSKRDPLSLKPGKTWQLPPILEPDDPVNFDSVLEWLTGLSDADYQKMVKIADIYRKADIQASSELGVTHKAVNKLLPKKLTGKQIDDGLDQLIVMPPKELKAAMQVDHKKPKSRRKVNTKS